MALSDSLSAELGHEASNTKKMLERVLIGHFDWKPHEKSFTLGRLATHVAELPSWAGYIVKADEFNLASRDYSKPNTAGSSSELMNLFEEHLAKAKEDLQDVSDETMMQNWTLKSGEQVFFTMPRIVVIRNMVLNHIVHHRAQLGVYLRLLDIPVPGMYGPTADEK